MTFTHISRTNNIKVYNIARAAIDMGRDRNILEQIVQIVSHCVNNFVWSIKVTSIFSKKKKLLFFINYKNWNATNKKWSIIWIY